MSGWTPERSTLLSMLLDEVTGTPEMIEIRQDFCRLDDCILSLKAGTHVYFTGSKAEGLDLPGSDWDYMFDFNEEFKLEITQTVPTRSEVHDGDLLFFNTANTPPCFVTLRFINQIKHPGLAIASRNMDGIPHLSSDLVVQNLLSHECHRGSIYILYYVLYILDPPMISPI